MFWQAMRNTLWIIAVGVPLQIVTSLLARHGCSRDRSEASRYYRTFLFLPTMVPPVAAALGFVFLFNPTFGPINQGLKTLGVDNPPLWFFSAVLVEVGAGLPRPVGRRADDDDLPRRPPRCPSPALRGGRDRRRRRVATVPLRHPADDLARDLLLGRDRRDRRVPVLHAGLHRELRGLRPADGRRGIEHRRAARSRRSSTRSTCTSRGSPTSRWATPRRWPGSCS